MNTVFIDLLDTSLVIYLDDLLIFIKTVNEYKKALDTMLACLAKH